MDIERYRILLIEDNVLDQMAFSRFVEGNALPYDCTIAGSVSEARKVLNTQEFDAVVSDHSLGDGTALDVLKLAGNMPVIVVTGAGDEETAVKAWKTGAYDYLVKDFNQSYLKAIPVTVENAIRHKMVESKLQLLCGAVMSTEDSVYITDMEGKIIFVNTAFCKAYGYKEEEILGENGSILWKGKRHSKKTRSVFQTKTSGSSWEVGFYHRRKDDSLFPVSLSRSHIKDPNGNDVAIVGVARDITDRILVEDRMRAESLELKQKCQLQNEIAVMVDEAVQKLLAKGNIGTAQKLVADHLELSRIEGGGIELQPHGFDLRTLVSQAVKDVQPLAAKHNVHLKNLAATDKLPVNGDRDRLYQVVSTLLIRVIMSSASNSHVSVAAKDIGTEFSVEILDQGQPPEGNEIHRILNSSDWIREQLSCGREDLALALLIANGLIRLQGGRMWTESSDASENILCFTVPKSSVPNSQKVPMLLQQVDAD